MAFLESQAFPGIVEEIDPTFRAGRVSLRPIEYGVPTNLAPGTKYLGHYAQVGTISAIAPAANSVLGAFRWADPSNFALLMRVWFSLQVVTAVTAQRLDALLMFIARAYTVRDATNATSIAIAGNAGKMRTTPMGTSLLSTSGNFDVASAAAGLSGGTKTSDANPMGSGGLSGSGAVAGLGTGVPNTDLYKGDKHGNHPQMLGTQEGFLVQWGATALATGTITLTIGVEWAEVAYF
jgi:hypothetical protein